MRTLIAVLLVTTFAAAQSATTDTPPAAPAAKTETANQLVIPSGTKVPVALKHAISTKGAKEGDPVYAETTFPVVANDRLLIPAGTYVQGRITHVQRAGRVKGRAEILMHFTTLIYPSGYTVLMPSSIENVPGAEHTSIKDQEGTIRQDGQKGHDIGTAAQTAATGALIGAAAKGGKGALIGGGIGGAAGAAIALLSRGSDVRMEAGTTLEMVIQRNIPLDANRIPTTGK